MGDGRISGGVTADSDSAGQYTGVTCHTWHRLRDCHAQSHVTVCVNSHLDENMRPLVQFWWWSQVKYKEETLFDVNWFGIN